MHVQTFMNVDDLAKILVVDPYLEFSTRKITSIDKNNYSPLKKIKNLIQNFLKSCDAKKTSNYLAKLAQDNRLLYIYNISNFD